MPPRHTKRRASSGGSRRGRSGSRAPWLTVALLVFAALAVAGFYFFNQERDRDRHQSIAAKAQKLARENPDAEVFSPAADTDSDVKKK